MCRGLFLLGLVGSFTHSRFEVSNELVEAELVGSKLSDLFFFSKCLPLFSERAVREKREEFEDSLIPRSEEWVRNTIGCVVERADEAIAPDLPDHFRLRHQTTSSFSAWHSTQHGTSGRKSRRFSGMGSRQPTQVPYVPAFSRAIAVSTMGRASSRFQSQWANGMVSSLRRARMSARLFTR